MRTLVCAFLLTATLSPDESSFGQNNKLTIYNSHFEREFKAWTKTINGFRLSSFKSRDTIEFQELTYHELTGLKDFYSIYKPALTFSKDSNTFIDIYSYELNLQKKGDKIVYSGSEVDQAVSLCDLKASRWTQILFCGASLRMQDATWLTDSKFMLVGSLQNEELKFRPVIYLGDMKKKSFEIFTSNDSRCLQNKMYDSPKIAKLNIHQE